MGWRPSPSLEWKGDGFGKITPVTNVLEHVGEDPLCIAWSCVFHVGEDPLLYCPFMCVSCLLVVCNMSDCGFLYTSGVLPARLKGTNG